MTRLTTKDISPIRDRLADYDRELTQKTGLTMLGLACHAMGKDLDAVIQRAGSFSIQVIPNTSGQGIISDFCTTVSAILTYLGFKSRVASESDVAGFAHAFTSNADAVMTADDLTFAGFNLHTRKVTDNSAVTGWVFASALDRMVHGGIAGKKVLIAGCGPVGEAAARQVIDIRGIPGVYDLDADKSGALAARLSNDLGSEVITVDTDPAAALGSFSCVIDATPASEWIPDSLLGPIAAMTAPGVPPGLSETGRDIMEPRLIHDKLELGVAAMAVDLIP